MRAVGKSGVQLLVAVCLGMASMGQAVAQSDASPPEGEGGSIGGSIEAAHSARPVTRGPIVKHRVTADHRQSFRRSVAHIRASTPPEDPSAALAPQYSCSESQQDCVTRPDTVDPNNCSIAFRKCMRTGHWIGERTHIDYGERRKE
jgi:hypothetical protein